ncbi:DUF4065 domain-containing protein [Pedobacter sp. MC2016-14]|uniref:Panacea domain-containing protein n=1 Tax=Pedobacter sp. MC2016-14 TaxID=2897327 RepID=UPI001E3DF860|nr:type II toxin-antitoxin system antitoxin SocA domain-containing protein [Pedobacter sp. MC2016-14]MCD0489944.1 DUF4065 domain-containing protein [Pedobacter sp. MC2016-14]
MYRPNLIANFFIKKSLDTGKEVTPMKLLKLVYIAHGWYLALADQDLIDEGVQAWKYGPVIPSVYHKFKVYGNNIINSLAKFDVPGWSNDPFTQGVEINNLSKISEDDKKFLDRIFEVYGDLSGIQLSNLTHEIGTPWYNVWNEQIGKNNREKIIPNNLIKEHYKNLK